MIIQFDKELSQEGKEKIIREVESIHYSVREVRTQYQDYLIAIGKGEFDIRRIGHLPGVKDIHVVTDSYQLVSRKWRVEDTCIQLGDGVQIDRGSMTIMTGPCSVERPEQVRETAMHLKENGIKVMRGGVFKPRSSPYSFRGIGLEGLKSFSAICKEHGIKIISEVMQVSEVEPMYAFVDIYQVGTRNTQNFNLLDALGKVDKPVMIKRGMSGTLDELLHSAEYVFSGGNERILICERGIRTHEKAYRNTLDLNAVPVLKDKTHLPVIVDPSHGMGIRKYIEAVSLAAVMAGADGLLIEIHREPEKAFSDGQQSLDFNEARALYEKIRKAYALRCELS